MKLLAFFVFVLFLSGCETTNTNRYVTDSLTAKSGRPTMLRAFYNVNPDCSANGVPKVIVVSPPSQGTVDISETRDFPKYATKDARHKCNGRRIRKMAAFYTPKPGFSGADQIKLKAIGNDGPDDLQHATFRVRVLK